MRENENSEIIVMDFEPRILGATERLCSFCGRNGWVSPSLFPVLDRDALVICLPCFIGLIKTGSFRGTIEPITAEQMKEIKDLTGLPLEIIERECEKLTKTLQDFVNGGRNEKT